MAECNKCFMDCLNWKKVEGKWRLFDGERLHDCIGLLPDMDVVSRDLVRHTIVDQHKEHLSRMEQDNTERLTTMVLGL